MESFKFLESDLTPDELRRKTAKDYGLSDNASWDEIEEASYEKNSRKILTKGEKSRKEKQEK